MKFTILPNIGIKLDSSFIDLLQNHYQLNEDETHEVSVWLNEIQKINKNPSKDYELIEKNKTQTITLMRKFASLIGLNTPLWMIKSVNKVNLQWDMIRFIYPKTSELSSTLIYDTLNNKFYLESIKNFLKYIVTEKLQLQNPEEYLPLSKSNKAKKSKLIVKSDESKTLLIILKNDFWNVQLYNSKSNKKIRGLYLKVNKNNVDCYKILEKSKYKLTTTSIMPKGSIIEFLHKLNSDKSVIKTAKGISKSISIYLKKADHGKNVFTFEIPNKNRIDYEREMNEMKEFEGETEPSEEEESENKSYDYNIMINFHKEFLSIASIGNTIPMEYDPSDENTFQLNNIDKIQFD